MKMKDIFWTCNIKEGKDEKGLLEWNTTKLFDKVKEQDSILWLWLLIH